MDAIRKKMQSLKGETDQLYAIIRNFEDEAKEAVERANQADCDIRDYGKKVQGFEIGFDETNDKLTSAQAQFEEAEKHFKEVEADIAALTRRIMLMEEEDKKSSDNLGSTITKLAITSKQADGTLKAVKAVESTCMNNEVVLEELDKNMRSTLKMAHDNEQKLDELSRKFGVQEAELNKGIERAELAEKNLKGVEEDLENVGENMKKLETSAEKALEREEKLVEKILSLTNKFKATEARYEYGEMNITKLNQRIDDIEDEIYREKLKVKRCSDELNETFDEFILGVVATFVCYGCCELRKKLGLDDALDVWGVHGMGGFLGTILLGALADDVDCGISCVNPGTVNRSWEQLGKQNAAAVFCAVYSFTVTFVLLKVINLVVPIKPDESKMSKLGSTLDAEEHGEEAYCTSPKKSSSGDFSPHVPESKEVIVGTRSRWSIKQAIKSKTASGDSTSKGKEVEPTPSPATASTDCSDGGVPPCSV